jgi:hypothetical protein
MYMEIWRTESNLLRQHIETIFVFLLGVFLVGSGGPLDMAYLPLGSLQFRIGALCLCISFLAIVFSYRQIVMVIPVERRIVVTKKFIIGKRERVILLRDITSVSLLPFGTLSTIFGRRYFVSLHLNDNSTYALFAPAYFDGSRSHAVMIDRAQRLENIIKNTSALSV